MEDSNAHNIPKSISLHDPIQSIIYTRKLHVMKTQYSKYYRLTVPKKLLKMFEKSLFADSVIYLQLNNNRDKVLINQIQRNSSEYILIESFSRNLINNHDGTFRVTIPEECMKILKEDNKDVIVGISLQHKEIIFEIHH